MANTIDQKKDALKGIVLLPNGEKKIVLENMVIGAGYKYSLLLIVPGKLGPDSVTSRTPGVCNGRLTFRDASVCQFYSTGLTAIQPKKLKDAVTVERKPSTVVLCKAVKAYATDDECAIASKHPQRAFTAWAASHACSILDTPVVHEVFSLTPKNTECSPWKVEWQERELDETEAAYLARAKRLQPDLGVVCGTRSLSLRILRAKDAVLPKIWCLEHVPNEWTQTEAQHLLQSSFADIYFLRRRKGGRGLCDFIFRASVDATLDIIPFVVKSDGHNVTYWAKLAPPRPQQVKSQKVKEYNSVDMGVGDQTVKTAAKVTLVEPVDGKDSGDAKKQKLVVPVRTLPKGMTKHTVAADGACLFHSVSKCLTFLSPPITQHPMELRGMAVEHLTKYSKDYLLDWDSKSPNSEALDSFDKYLEKIVDQKACASSLEIKALARKMDLAIVVASENINIDPVLYHKDGKRGTIYLWHSGGNHFDALEGQHKEAPGSPDTMHTVWTEQHTADPSSFHTTFARTPAVGQPSASSSDIPGPMPQIASLPSSSSTARAPTTPVRDIAMHGREDNLAGGEASPSNAGGVHSCVTAWTPQRTVGTKSPETSPKGKSSKARRRLCRLYGKWRPEALYRGSIRDVDGDLLVDDLAAPAPPVLSKRHQHYQRGST
eukprot:s1106_g7.t1